jgi:plasmid maintenance system antidote protein VapI
MKLSEFLEETGCPVTKFARRVGVSAGTIKNVLLGKHDIRLSVAIKIEEGTLGKDKKPAVTYRELISDELLNKNKNKKKEGKQHQNHQEY